MGRDRTGPERAWARAALVASAALVVSCGPTVRDRHGNVVPRASIEDSLLIHDVPPRAVSSPPPHYPPQALAAGLRGRVWVRVTVPAAGHVVAASVDSATTVAMLTNAALRAVREWRFEPALRNGRRVMSQTVIPFHFRP